MNTKSNLQMTQIESLIAQLANSQKRREGFAESDTASKDDNQLLMNKGWLSSLNT
jgi:hypothetical protein